MQNMHVSKLFQVSLSQYLAKHEILKFYFYNLFLDIL